MCFKKKLPTPIIIFKNIMDEIFLLILTMKGLKSHIQGLGRVKKRAEIVGPNKPNLFESLDVGGKKSPFSFKCYNLS